MLTPKLQSALIAMICLFSLLQNTTAQTNCNQPNENDLLLSGYKVYPSQSCGETEICFDISQCHNTKGWKVEINLPQGIVVTDPTIFSYNSTTNMLTYSSTQEVQDIFTMCIKIANPTADFSFNTFGEHRSLGLTFFDYDCTEIKAPGTVNGPANSSNPIVAANLSKPLVYVSGILTLDRSATYLNKTFVMGPGAQIICSAGKVFTFEQCEFKACDKMWKGILIETGATVTFGKGSIKDAEFAIDLQNNGKVISSSLSATSLERNFIGVKIDGMPVAYSKFEFTVVGGPLRAKYDGQLNWNSKSQDGYNIKNCTERRSLAGTFANLENGIRCTGNSNLEARLVNCTNCTYGVRSSYSDLVVSESTFADCYNGIMVEFSRNKKIEIVNNSRIEAVNAITLFDSYGVDARVQLNNIHAKGKSGVTALNGIQALLCRNANKLEIANNHIFYSSNGNALKGIRINGTNRVKVLENEVKTTTAQDLATTGIALANATNAIVKDNTCTGGTINKGTGIYVTASSNWQICHNHLNTYKKGVEFYSASPSPKRFSHNDMTNHEVGLELDPSSVIGVQYSYSIPFQGAANYYTMNNKWVGDLPVGARFLTNNKAQVEDSFFGVSLNSQPDKPNVIDCPYQWFGTNYSYIYPCFDLDDDDSEGKIERAIAGNQLALQDYTSTGRWVAQQQLYDATVFGGKVFGSQLSSSVDNFVLTSASSDLGKLAMVKDLINQYQAKNIVDPYAIDGILQVNNSVTGTEEFIQNEKTFNNIYINSILRENYTLTTNQMQDLAAIANQCDLSGGTAVHSARALYRQLVENGTDFDQVPCPEVGNRSQNVERGEIATFTVFPNPANQAIQLSGLSQYPASSILQVADIYGKVCSTCPIESGNTLDIHSLPTGIYFCAIMDKGQQLAITKFSKIN